MTSTSPPRSVDKPKNNSACAEYNIPNISAGVLNTLSIYIYI